MNKVLFLLFLFCIKHNLWGQNPIVPNQGLNDPHVHIFNDTAYVYASHDKSAENTSFIMEDWWVWSSPDLVNWTQRSVLKPENTYIGEGFTGCWATDVGRKNGKYYWYFSEKNHQSGVVVGESPTGPWKDPLGKPLLSENLTPTHEYDIAIFEEAGEHYILFGVWDYFIAKLNEDMISLAEEPRKIQINNPRGPYNQDGKNQENPTDDKPFLHKYQDKYYLSWGCFYALADNLYGPYNYMGTVINQESFAKGYAEPTWPNGFLQGRHGSFFEWHNQWYFAYCDISQTGNRYFRDTFISYVHYKKNGEMAPIRVDGIGVGQYQANQGQIEAEDYFKINRLEKNEFSPGKFGVQNKLGDGWLYYPNIAGLKGFKYLNLNLIVLVPDNFILEVRKDGPTGELITTERVETKNPGTKTLKLTLPPLGEKENFVIIVKDGRAESTIIDAFFFTKQ